MGPIRLVVGAGRVEEDVDREAQRLLALLRAAGDAGVGREAIGAAGQMSAPTIIKTPASVSPNG